MKVFPILILMVTAIFSSCQYFNTERISSETFYEEELETIDWKEIDTFPAFKECEIYTEKEDQKVCFQTIVFNAIQKTLLENKVVTSQTVLDTIKMMLQIQKSGLISIDEIKVDTLLYNKIPTLEVLLKQSIEQLPIPAPAYKRGIPVTTKITLPIVLNSTNL